MLLALDVGNGSIKYGRFDDGRLVDEGRVPLDGDPMAFPPADRVAAVSVNPPALARLRERLPGLLVAGEHIAPPLPVRYDPPAACGLDRVFGVAGALRLEADAAGVLLLDVGTCLTATVGVRDGGVLGGAILPGRDLMARALHEGTAQLPLVAPGPFEALGRSTEESIRSGIDAAVAGGARELVRRLRASCDVALRVVATGTGAVPLAGAVREIDAVHPLVSLWGLLDALAGR